MAEKKVRKIEATAPLHTAQAFAPVKKRRVAGYARVSTDKDEQQNSYEAQVDYYTSYIQSNPEWIFAGVYSDAGITGTSMKKRDGFNQMVADALAGKIDIKPRYLIQSRLQYSQRKCKNSGFRSSLSIRSRYFSFGGKLARRKQEPYWIALEPPAFYLNPL